MSVYLCQVQTDWSVYSSSGNQLPACCTPVRHSTLNWTNGLKAEADTCKNFGTLPQGEFYTPDEPGARNYPVIKRV